MGCAPSIRIFDHRAANHRVGEDRDANAPGSAPLSRQRRSIAPSSGRARLVEPHPPDGGASKVSSPGSGAEAGSAGSSRRAAVALIDATRRRLCGLVADRDF